MFYKQDNMLCIIYVNVLRLVEQKYVMLTTIFIQFAFYILS